MPKQMTVLHWSYTMTNKEKEAYDYCTRCGQIYLKADNPLKCNRCGECIRCEG